MASSSSSQAAPSNVSSTKNTGRTYPVFLVRSRQSLTWITNFINDKTRANPNNVGLTRIWRGFDGKDNNLTLVMGYDAIYPILVSQGYGPDGKNRKHFKISPFDIRNYQYPASHDTNDLFIPIPPEIKKHGDAAISVSIEMKLHHMAAWGMIPDKSWEIIIPLTDRLDSTSVKGMVFINFHKDKLTVQDIAMIRVVLDDGVWQEFSPDGTGVKDSKYPFRCCWAHKARHDTEQRHAEASRFKKNDKKRHGTASPPTEQGERKSRPMFAQNVKMVSLVSATQPQLKNGSDENLVIAAVPFEPTIPADPIVETGESSTTIESSQSTDDTRPLEPLNPPTATTPQVAPLPSLSAFPPPP